MPRSATIHRKTNETDVRLKLNLDGRGKSQVTTGIRFFDHMLDLVARHGAFDLEITAKGDLDVDQHHTVEDVGIALGEAVVKALGSKRGILRAGYFLMPMDETLAAAAVDLGGRPYCVVKAKISAKRVGDFQTELTEDFFQGFAQAARANVHLRALYGRSSHHQVEAIFKAFARALRFAVSRDKRLRQRPSQHERPPVKVTLIDYGAGNVTSVERALQRLGAVSQRSSSPECIAKAEVLLLPGVGHYAALIRALDERALRAPLLDAIQRGVPFLGVCLGLQALYETSEEAPELRGLKLFSGSVRSLPASVKLPHMGWNQLKLIRTFASTRGNLRRRLFLFRPLFRRHRRERRIRRSLQSRHGFCRRGRKEKYLRRAIPS